MFSTENIEVGIDFVSDYKDNKVYRDSFNQLANLVFGIHFEDWYQKGFWDDRYICHSFLKDHEVIANVSISKMDLMIDGVNKKAIQIGTVMTHPDYRGKGLSGILMRHVLDMYISACLELKSKLPILHPPQWRIFIFQRNNGVASYFIQILVAFIALMSHFN